MMKAGGSQVSMAMKQDATWVNVFSVTRRLRRLFYAGLATISSPSGKGRDHESNSDRLEIHRNSGCVACGYMGLFQAS